MALPQSELDQCTPLFETCNLPDTVRETMNARQLLRGPLLWNTVIDDVETKTQMKADDQILHSTGEHWVKLSLVEILHSLDWLCEETLKEFEGSSLGQEFTVDSLEKELICLHKEGSFNLQGPGAVAGCLHLACVICLHCILLCLRIDLQSKGPAAMIAVYSGLADHYVQELFDKWSAKSKNSFDQFQDLTDNTEDPGETMKLLYQWTLLPLQFVLRKVERVMKAASPNDYDEMNRIGKWGGKICDFLEECRQLFISENFEFLYDIISRIYHQTALLQRRMENEKRTTSLGQTLGEMLEDIWSKRENLMIAEWKKGRITYKIPNDDGIFLRNLLYRKREVCNIIPGDDSKDVKLKKIDEELVTLFNRKPGLVSEFRFCGFFDQKTAPYDGRVNYIISALGLERFDKARECFEQVDLMNDKEFNASFRDFLQYAITDTDIARLIAHSCLRKPLEWESVRKKQNFYLDVCEAIGDRQLTAIYLQSIGLQIAQNSFQKLRECFHDAHEFKLRLKEELNLRKVPSPKPVDVDVLNSYLNDPCKLDEHRRADLPDMLMAYRLLKRSIDIYSDLLHNWTQRSSNEAEWLKLLESQKSAHETLLSVLLGVCTICYKTLMETNKSSVGANYHLVSCSVSRTSALKRAFLELSSITLVWTERGRARTLLNQLGPWYNYTKQRDGDPGSLKEELDEFDSNQEAALSSIYSCRLVCTGEPLFVEYVTQTLINSHSSYMNKNNCLAYIIHRQAEVQEGVMFHLDGKEVEKLVKKFYKAIDKFQKPKSPPDIPEAELVLTLHRALEGLYDILIEPLVERPFFKHLDPEATLIFVPDKNLYRVPFALLRGKKIQKHLFQLHPIAVAPSLRVLQHCERRLRDLERSPLKPEGNILAVGNAAYEKNSLPGTAKELEHLRLCFPGRVKTIEKDEATRVKFLELVKEASHSTEQHVFACIHLGVHGHWSKDEPQVSAEGKKQYKTGSLQFAKLPQHTRGSKGPTTDIYSSGVGTNQTPILELEQQFTSKAATTSSSDERYRSAFGEVGAMIRAEGYSSTAEEDMLPSEDIIKGGFQWPTRLVVLSACNSSRGQAYTDGEVNLPRALMIAGVPVAVVSQWKVDDSASPALMKAFYENLQYGQDVATALQSSMIQLLNSDSESANNIFKWGPFLVWGLPTVELPKELWTENARKSLPAKQIAKALIDPLNSVQSRMSNFDQPDDMKVSLLNALKTVKSFLEPATWNACALEVKAITDVIVAIERLLTLSRDIDHFPYDAIDLAEKVYVLLPLNLLKLVDTETQFFSTHFWDQLYNSWGVEFDKGPGDFQVFKIRIWRRITYTQAMNGSHQLAFDYANKMIEAIQNAYRCGYDKSIMQEFKEDEELVRQERAVILRLMGKYEEALREFDDILALRENRDCLNQMSYLKYLLEDRSGALEYARRAKILKFRVPFKPGQDAFLLSSKARPDNEYSQFLSASRSIRSLPTMELPKELWTENERKFHAKHLAELLGPKLDDVVESLRCHFDDTVVDAAKIKNSKLLKTVKKFLESASAGSTGCVDEEEDEDDLQTIGAIGELLDELGHVPLVSKEIYELAKDVYALLPLDRLQRLELNLTTVGIDILVVRQRIMYTQAMKGNHQTALEYVNRIIEARQSEYECGCPESELQAFRKVEEVFRQERAVILRLMGKYDEALKESDDILALKENYECLIQTSYLKHLMEDKEGALDYACRAKRLEDSTLSRPGYGAFFLGFSALPDEYRQWLLNVDEVTGAPLPSLWSLPTVQLPKELWTQSTRKALAAKPRLVALKWKFKCKDHKEENMSFITALNAVDTFLVSVYNACAVEEDAIACVIVATESLLAFTRRFCFFKEVIAVVEDVYTVMPLEQLQSIEIKTCSTQFWNQLHLFRSVDNLDKSGVCENFEISVRQKIMYTQAMNGNPRVAFVYANKMIEAIRNAYICGYEIYIMQECEGTEEFVRREKAVILRLMGMYEEALREFDDILALREKDYECLIQTSYLKSLMMDQTGALNYARRAKKFESDKTYKPVNTAFCLGYCALPDEYRRWLLEVDDDSTGASRPQFASNQCSTPQGGMHEDSVKLGVNILLELEPVLTAWANGLNT